MENLLFLGVPILKHIRVFGVNCISFLQVPGVLRWSQGAMKHGVFEHFTDIGLRQGKDLLCLQQAGAAAFPFTLCKGFFTLKIWLVPPKMMRSPICCYTSRVQK